MIQVDPALIGQSGIAQVSTHTIYMNRQEPEFVHRGPTRTWPSYQPGAARRARGANDQHVLPGFATFYMNVSRIRLVSSHPVLTADRMGTLVSLLQISVLYMSPASLARKYLSCFCFALSLSSMYFFWYALLPSFLHRVCSASVTQTQAGMRLPALGGDVAGTAQRVNVKWLSCTLAEQRGWSEAHSRGLKGQGWVAPGLRCYSCG